MENLELEAKKRETGKKAKQLLVKEKSIPAVVYGHQLKSEAIAVPYIQFEKIFRNAGENTLIWLKIGTAKKQVLIYDFQKDPVTDKFIHIDFYAVRMDEKITAAVPLNFTGVSPAVKNEGGILVKNMESIKVKCLPKDLPHEIKIDVSALKSFTDRIKVSDLKVGPGVEILIDDKNQVVANVVLPKAEKEEVGKPEEKVEEVEGVKPKEEPVSDEKKSAASKAEDKESPKK